MEKKVYQRTAIYRHQQRTQSAELRLAHAGFRVSVPLHAVPLSPAVLEIQGLSLNLAPLLEKAFTHSLHKLTCCVSAKAGKLQRLPAPPARPRLPFAKTQPAPRCVRGMLIALAVQKQGVLPPQRGEETEILILVQDC